MGLGSRVAGLGLQGQGWGEAPFESRSHLGRGSSKIGVALAYNEGDT